ncbi:MAG TPA: HWE histidine kinase domain-containing protein [Xanthobacteraceae bacterium]|nr:HWE histidine kinase domain-containing protein [Xanthobacteraceae bacterium]
MSSETPFKSGDLVRLDPTQRRSAGLDANSDQLHELLRALPAAVYTTDSAGRITFYNEAAANLWGCRPTLHSDAWLASWRLFSPSGTVLPYDQSPLAIKEGHAAHGVEAVGERINGVRVPFLAFQSPLRDTFGNVIGAVNMLVDITERKQAAERESQHQERLTLDLADVRRLQEISSRLLQGDKIAALCDSIVDCALDLLHSDMANMQVYDPARCELQLLAVRGFDQAIFNAFEWVGENTGTCCAASLRAGQRIVVPDIETCDFITAHEGLRKCGIRAVQSTPLLSRSGELLGMISTHWRSPHEPTERELLLMDVLAREAADLIERKRNEELITLLGREAEHRTKNLLSTVQATIHLTQADSPKAYKEALEGRIQALANVQSLFVQSRWAGAELRNLVVQELSPYRHGEEARIRLDGPDVILEPNAAQAVALSLHELTTNAAKYGALSGSGGHVQVEWSCGADGQVSISWSEMGGPPVKPPTRQGFGTWMLQSLIHAQARGRVHFDWRTEGLVCQITLRGVCPPPDGRVGVDCLQRAEWAMRNNKPVSPPREDAEDQKVWRDQIGRLAGGLLLERADQRAFPGSVVVVGRH